MSRKIAPVLTQRYAQSRPVMHHGKKMGCAFNSMRDEVRALLAVARAAEYDQRVRHQDFPDMDPPVEGSAWDRLDRALARLRRASEER